MKFKEFIKLAIIYFLVILALYSLINNSDVEEKIVRYILFNTEVFKFQEVLSISITVLSILLGAVITVATVLISMCNKRAIKLISRFNMTSYLISAIYIAILSGIITIILLSIVYARIDFNILYFRVSLLFVSGLSLIIFLKKSLFLIELVINTLKDSFDNDDSIILK